MSKQPAIHYLLKRGLLFIGVILVLTLFLDLVGNNLMGLVLEGWPTDSALVGLGYTVAAFLLGTTLTRESQLIFTQFNYSRQTQFKLILLGLLSIIFVMSLFKIGYISLASGLSWVSLPKLTYFSPVPSLNLIGNLLAQFVGALLLVFLGWFYQLLKQHIASKWLPVLITGVVAVSPVIGLVSTIILPQDQRIWLIDFAKQPLILLILGGLALLIFSVTIYQLFKKATYI